MEELESVLKFLMDYPLEEKPYPPGYPEDLKFEEYPGKDFVIGLCDECIDTSIQLYPEAKSKEIMREWIKLLKTVREIRIKKLAAYHRPPGPTPKPLPAAEQPFEEMVKESLF